MRSTLLFSAAALAFSVMPLMGQAQPSATCGTATTSGVVDGHARADMHAMGCAGSTVTPSAAVDPSAAGPMPMISAAASAASDVSATVTVQTVTNGPVLDTPENRAKYGPPLSNAGRRTAAAGN